MNAPAPSSMLDGLTFSEGPEDLYRCVACRQLRPHEGGEPQPYGEQVCQECAVEVIECPNCEGWFKRAEFVTPTGISSNCSECDHARDLWEQMRGAQP